MPFACGAGSRPASMLTWTLGKRSRGAASVASRAVRKATKSAYVVDALMWTFPSIDAPMVVSHATARPPGW